MVPCSVVSVDEAAGTVTVSCTTGTSEVSASHDPFSGIVIVAGKNVFPTQEVSLNPVPK
jgi:hypothetical protein